MIKWEVGLVSTVLLISLSVKSQISDFYLFPNPFTERVKIKFTSQALWQSNYDLRVFDITGQERIIKLEIHFMEIIDLRLIPQV